MKRFAFALMMGIAAVSTVGQAHAGLLFDFLTYDGIEDQLNDESRGSSSGAPFAPAIGDIIFGVMRFSDVFPGEPALNPPTVAAIFSARVAATPALGVFSLAPVGDVLNPLDLRNLAPMLTTDSGLSDAVLDDAIFVVASRLGDNNYLFRGNGILAGPTAGGPLASDTAIIASIDAELSAAGGYDLTGGFGSDPDDFFTATLGLGFFSEQGLFSVLGDSTGGLVDYNPVPLFPLGPASDIALRVGAVFPNGGSPSAPAWDYQDTADFFVNPTVPEASSCLIWGGLALSAGYFGYRRRR
jgi:hypothetical protein